MTFNGVRKNQLKALQNMSGHSGNRPGHTGISGDVQPMIQNGGIARARGPFGPGVDPANLPLPNTLAQAPTPPTPPSSPGLVGQPRLMRDISQQRATTSGDIRQAPEWAQAEVLYPSAAMDALSNSIAGGAHWDQANKAKAWNDNRRSAVTGALQGAQQTLARGGNAGLYQGGGIPVGAAAPKASDALAGYDQALKARAERRANRAKESAIRASQNAEASVADNADRLRELGYLGEDDAATMDNVQPHISAPGASERLAGNEKYQDYRGRLKARREDALALRRSSLPYRQQTQGNDLNVQTLGGPMGTVQNNVQQRFGGPRMSLAQGIEAAQRYEEGPDNQAMRRLAWTDPEAYGRIQTQREQIAANTGTAKMVSDAQRDIATGRDNAMIKTTEMQGKTQESISKGQNKVARKEGKRRSSDLQSELESKERVSKEDREAQERVAAMTVEPRYAAQVAERAGLSLAAELGVPQQGIMANVTQAAEAKEDTDNLFGADTTQWRQSDFFDALEQMFDNRVTPTDADLAPFVKYMQGMSNSNNDFINEDGNAQRFMQAIQNGQSPTEAFQAVRAARQAENSQWRDRVRGAGTGYMGYGTIAR